MSNPLILFPFGGNAREALICIDAINKEKKVWDVIGFLDDDAALRGQSYCGIRILGGREMLRDFPDVSVLAVPGCPADYLARKNVIEGLGLPLQRFATIFHPSVIMAADVSIGHNVLLMPHVVVSSCARVGNHCIVLPNTVVSHDAVLGDYCCVGSNVSISGGVNIRERVYIGSGTRIKESITVGPASLIGLGSNVVEDIPPAVTVVGNPAKIIHQSHSS